MRVLMHVTLPHEPFNSFVRDGSVGAKISRVLEETSPEAIYFTEQDGQRGAVVIYDISANDQVPSLAEPWFLMFEADCRFNIAMTPDDLRRADLDALGQKWGADEAA
jgi:hypothetical protein